MGRKRKRGTQPLPVREVGERAQKFAESPTVREVGEQLRKLAQSPTAREVSEKVRKFAESPTARKLGEMMRQFQQVQAPPRKRRPGGRPHKLTPEEITAGIRLLSSHPKMQVKGACALLRRELKLDRGVSDSSLYRDIVSKVHA